MPPGVGLPHIRGSDMEPTCVYQYYDHSGRILYVGITGRGIKRSHEHAKSKDWWSQTTGCHIEHFASREDALARESYLIAAYKPPFNTQGVARNLTLDEIAAARQSAGEVLSDMAVQLEMYQIEEARSRKDWPAAIRQWNKLPKKYKHIFGCVRCRSRATSSGAMCSLCHLEYTGGMTRAVRREMARAVAQQSFSA